MEKLFAAIHNHLIYFNKAPPRFHGRSNKKYRF